MMQSPSILVVLDGFGQRSECKNNAIAQAYTPTLNYLLAHYPHTSLKAHGQYVGLLPNYMGNSEVGHMTIGSGRIIDQPGTRMHELTQNGQLIQHPVMRKYLKRLAKSGGTLHIMGLLSDAGVHSDIQNIYAYVEAAAQMGIDTIVLDCFLDGRDTPPRSAQTFLQELDTIASTNSGTTRIFISSLCGRFYAMDRNQEWARTQDAYLMLTTDSQPRFDNWHEAIEYFYAQGITDEFIPPTRLRSHTQIRNGDGIIFINFRPDRARQLTRAFVDPAFKAFARTQLALICFITPVSYEEDVATQILLEPIIISDCLMDVLCQQGVRIFAIAETEKYAHVTYFFNGGHEKSNTCEQRVLIPSISTTTYKDLPCMSASLITQTVIENVRNNAHDFYLINYANADMVGHSGDFHATVKAIECLDKQLAQLYQHAVRERGATIYICGDHGNAEEMVDHITGQPHTQHTLNPTPFIMVDPRLKDKIIALELDQLSQIAPFILKQMGYPVPTQMVHV